MNAVPCPAYVGAAKPCPTHVQRTVSGTLVDGLAAHLNMVHGIPTPEAVQLAAETVQGRQR